MTVLNQIGKPASAGYSAWLLVSIAVLVFSSAGLGHLFSKDRLKTSLESREGLEHLMIPRCRLLRRRTIRPPQSCLAPALRSPSACLLTLYYWLFAPEGHFSYLLHGPFACQNFTGHF